jgi:hypothetical protein
MMLFVFYFVFLTIFSVIGGIIGYLVEPSYPGSGSLITVAIFMIALWGAWTLSVRLVDHYWPEDEKSKPAA